MKISSASKKVLASALSAAMVVAFAPTVAFGAVNEGDTVTVKFDTAGLTLQDGSSPFVEGTYRVGANGVVDLGSNFAANHVYKSGSNEIQWYYDANGNGELDGSESAITNGQFTIDAATDLDNNTVTLKANVVTDFTVSGAPSSAQGWYAPYEGYTGLWFGVTVAEAGIYSATLSKDGAEIASLPLKNLTASDNQLGSFTFVDALDDSHKASNGYIAKDTFGTGTYALTVTNAAGKKVTKSFSVVKVSLSGIFGASGSEKSGQTVYAYKGQTLHTVLTGFSNSTVFGQDASAVKYVNGVAKKATAYTLDGVNVEGLSGDTLTELVETKLKGDVVLGTVYEDEVDPTLALSGKSITLKLGNTADDVDYKAVISVNGTEYPTTKAAFNWDSAQEIYSFGTSGAQGGTYSVVVYKLTQAGTGTIEEKVAEKSIDLAAVTLDAGEGKLAATQKANLGVFQAGTVYKSAVLNGVVDPTPKDKTAKFLGWSLDGTNVLKSTDKVASGTAAVTLKAVYSSVKAAAPAYEWANDSLTLTNTAGDGYKVVYQYAADGSTFGSTTDYTGPIQLKKGAAGAVKAWTVKTAANTSGKADSAAVVIKNSSNAKTALDNAVNGLALTATKTTSDSTANAPKYYATALKDQIAAAKAVVTDKAFASEEDWAKLVKQQTGAVLQLVADYETAQIDALAAGVKGSDGSVKKIGTATADKQKAAIAQVVTDWTYVNDDDDTTVASKTHSDYVADITKAAKAAADAAVTYKAADVTAAEAVTKQLKEAKTAVEAKAAVEAYNKLTATQKELVSASDVAAANEIVTKATITDSQDLAAARDLNGKKVTAKAKVGKKAQGKSFTYKLAASESGATASYAKVSGSKYIKISKSGKVTFSKVKVQKKAKTYKAKVSVTYGTQTVTKTVQLVVKKK